MGDLVADALAVFEREQETKKQQEAARLRAVQAEAEAKQARLLEAAFEWAVPILNRKFGERDDWLLKDATPISVNVRIGERGGNRQYELTVFKTGVVRGRFQTVASGGRYSGRIAQHGEFEVQDLAHLGALIARDRGCWEQELDQDWD